MYYKNSKKNRDLLLAQDLIIKYPLENIKDKILQEKDGFIKSIQIQSNLDFKKYRGVSYTSKVEEENDNKKLAKIRLLTLFFSLLRITGQLPNWTKTKKSVANFNIRKGMVTGIKINLRKKALERFYKKLNFLILPSKGENYINLKLKKFKPLLRKVKQENTGSGILSIYNFSHSELISLQPVTSTNSSFLWVINNQKKNVLFNKLLNNKKNIFIKRKNLSFKDINIKEIHNDLFLNHMKKEPSDLGINILIDNGLKNKVKIKNYPLNHLNFFILSYFLIPCVL